MAPRRRFLVKQLRHEVWKYTVKDPNYGKAARRLYNVFRLTGHYAEAVYLRELERQSFRYRVITGIAVALCAGMSVALWVYGG